MAKDQYPKVFDVAKPGKGKTSIGSKPMIVGHKSMAHDPMMVKDQENTAPQEDKLASKVVKNPSETKKTLRPISHDLKDTTGDAEKDNVETEKTQKAPPETDNSAETVKKNDNSANYSGEAGSGSAEDTKKKHKINPTAEAMESENNLQKLIDSKKYFVHIKESKPGRGWGYMFLVSFITLLVIAAMIIVLIDAEIVDVGVNLPFDLL